MRKKILKLKFGGVDHEIQEYTLDQLIETQDALARGAGVLQTSRAVIAIGLGLDPEAVGKTRVSLEEVSDLSKKLLTFSEFMTVGERRGPPEETD